MSDSKKQQKHEVCTDISMKGFIRKRGSIIEPKPYSQNEATYAACLGNASEVIITLKNQCSNKSSTMRLVDNLPEGLSATHNRSIPLSAIDSMRPGLYEVVSDYDLCLRESFDKLPKLKNHRHL